MRNSILKHFRPASFAGLICLGASLVLTSCSKTPQQQIVGKWSVQGQPGTIEFRKDGSVVTVAAGKESASTYKFLNETNMEMDTIAMVGTNKISIRVNASIVFFNPNTANFSVAVPQKQGMAPGNVTLLLQRVK